MKEMIKIISVLTSVCLVCALLLAVVYGLAKDRIENNNYKKIQEAIANLAPLAASMQKVEVNGDKVYKLFNLQHKLIGYAFLAQGQGYQGKIQILAIINASLDYLKGLEIIESIETPGLGAKIAEDIFKQQFNNLAVANPIELTKNTPIKDNEIKAITGATISSKAVVNILNKKIEELKNNLLR